MTAIAWNQARTAGATDQGHRVAILSKEGTGTRVVQVKLPPGGNRTELCCAVEEGGDVHEQAQRMVDTGIVTARALT